MDTKSDDTGSRIVFASNDHIYFISNDLFAVRRGLRIVTYPSGLWTDEVKTAMTAFWNSLAKHDHNRCTHRLNSLPPSIKTWIMDEFRRQPLL